MIVIAGGGPAGLSCAIELGLRGIDVSLFEERLPPADRRAALTAAPRAKHINIRSMEHFRRWNLTDQMRAATPLPDIPLDIAFVTSLDGYEVHRFKDAFVALDRVERSPEQPLQIPQPCVEAVLRDAAAALPSVRLHFGARIEAFSQDEGGVEVEYTDSDGNRRSVRAGYLVGADGARSLVRRSSGIDMHGKRAITRSINVVFRAPALREKIAHAPAVQYWVIGSKRSMMIGPLDSQDLWWIIFQRAAVDTEGNFDALAEVREDLPLEQDDLVEILDVTPWEAHELIADHYRNGRVFLIGDAAHLHPPSGGHGLNMGIGDAVNLGWKLAAAERGWGGEALLESYEDERRQIHLQVVDQAVKNWSSPAVSYQDQAVYAAGPSGAFARGELGAKIAREKLTEFHSLGLVLGYSYQGSPIVQSSGGEKLNDVAEYHPSAGAGDRAPHVRLNDGRVLFDGFGRDFTLLAFGDADVDSFEKAAVEQHVPLKIVRVDDDAARALYGSELVLIRPDQHVAWRRTPARKEEDAMEIIARARGAALADTPIAAFGG